MAESKSAYGITPGPWEVSIQNSGSIFGDLDTDHDGDNPYIGTVHGVNINTPEDSEAMANARAIAKVPEMLDKLRITTIQLARIRDAHGNQPGHCNYLSKASMAEVAGNMLGEIESLLAGLE